MQMLAFRRGDPSTSFRRATGSAFSEMLERLTKSQSRGRFALSSAWFEHKRICERCRLHPLPGIDQLAEAVANANALFGRCTAAEALAHQLPGFGLIACDIAHTATGSANAAKGNLDQPGAAQVGSCFQAIGAETPQGGFAGFEQGRECVHHGLPPSLSVSISSDAAGAWALAVLASESTSVE